MTSKNFINFFCDANAQVGLGHFKRCLSFLELFPNKFEEVYVFGDVDKEFVGKVMSHLPQKLNFYYLNKSLFKQKYKKKTLVLFDSYLNSEQKINDLLAISDNIVVFDDFAEHSFKNVKNLINFRLGAKDLNSNYSAKNIFLGLDYFYPGSEIEKIKMQRSINLSSDIAEIVVSLGATSLDSTLYQIVEILSFFFKKAKIYIFSNDKNMKKHENTYSYPLSNKIYEKLATCDLVICSGGRMKYEAVYCEIPCLVYSLNQGQKEDTENFLTQNLVYKIGDFNTLISFENCLPTLRKIADIKTRNLLQSNAKKIFSRRHSELIRVEFEEKIF